MQFKTLVVAAFFGLATAAVDPSTIISQIPSCALTCLLTGAASANCDVTDYACQCKNFDAIQKTVAPCVQGACSTADQTSTFY